MLCAEGLYTEMDFRNEALNAIRMKMLLRESEFVDSEAVVIPEPNLALTTRSAHPQNYPMLVLGPESKASMSIISLRQ